MSTNRTILTENIIATHRSLVKNSTAVKRDYDYVIRILHTAIIKYGSRRDSMLKSGKSKKLLPAKLQPSPVERGGDLRLISQKVKKMFSYGARKKNFLFDPLSLREVAKNSYFLSGRPTKRGGG